MLDFNNLTNLKYMMQKTQLHEYETKAFLISTIHNISTKSQVEKYILNSALQYTIY